MSKVSEHIKKYFLNYLISFVIGLVVGVAIFLIVYYVQNQTLVAALNGTGIAFASIIALAGMSALARAGAFDTFSYGFTQMFSSMFSKEANKYHDMVAYKEEKNTKRSSSAKTYYSLLLASLFFLIAFIILEIVKSNIH